MTGLTKFFCISFLILVIIHIITIFFGSEYALKMLLAFEVVGMTLFIGGSIADARPID